MGTRALTFVYENHAPLVNIYTHYDGYPSDHGLELAKILKDRVLVNGISNPLQENASNGMGCLAATIVAKLKTGIGGVYLYSLRDRDAGQDYEYHIHKDHGVVKYYYKNINIFDGTWNEFYEFCMKN